MMSLYFHVLLRSHVIDRDTKGAIGRFLVYQLVVQDEHLPPLHYNIFFSTSRFVFVREHRLPTFLTMISGILIF